MEDSFERSQITFYKSFFDAIRRIRKDADRAKAYDAVFSYAFLSELPDFDALPDSAAIAFDLIKPNLDASRRKAKSGKTGGSAKQTESKPEAKQEQGEPASKKENKKEKEGENKKENECSPPIPPQFSPALHTAVDDWLRYKAERRETYKPTGLKQLFTQIGNCAAEYGDAEIIKLISESMASNYQGIMFDRAGRALPRAAMQKTRYQDADEWAAEMEARYGT